MHRTVKKYETPPGQLPSILEKAIPTQEEALQALLKELEEKEKIKNQNINFTTESIDSDNLLKTAADEEAFADIIADQEKAKGNDGGSKGNDSGSVGLNKDSKFGGLTNTLSGLTSLASSFIDVDDNSSFNQQQMVGNMLMNSNNPYAMAAGAVWNTMSVVDQALGINVNTINKKEADFAGISKGERLINNALGFIPGTGAGLLAGKTDEFNFDQRLNSLSSSYGNSLNDMKLAEGMSGGRYIVGKKKINDSIRELEEDQSALLSSKNANTLRMNSDYNYNLDLQNTNRFAGNNYTMTAVGKHGLKLLSKEGAKMLIESRTHTKDGIALFKDGGKVNILPEGKLHAHNHHLEDVDERLEDLTKKGIPIVTVSESGEISQVAEVEKEELILHLDLTQQVEALWEQYKNTEDPVLKNKIAFECGDLLCKEIITNTEDNTNLIKEL